MGLLAGVNSALALAFAASLVVDLALGMSATELLSSYYVRDRVRGLLLGVLLLVLSWLALRGLWGRRAVRDEDRYGRAQLVVAFANTAWLFAFVGAARAGDGAAFFFLVGLPIGCVLTLVGLAMVEASTRALGAHEGKRDKGSVATAAALAIVVGAAVSMLSRTSTLENECYEKCLAQGAYYVYTVPTRRCDCTGRRE